MQERRAKEKKWDGARGGEKKKHEKRRQAGEGDEEKLGNVRGIQKRRKSEQEGSKEEKEKHKRTH